MLIPKDQTTLIVWNRALTAFDPENRFQIISSLSDQEHRELCQGKLPPQLLPKLESHLSSDAESQQTLEQLNHLDQAYNGWIPGALAAHSQPLKLIAQAHSRRRVFFGANQSWPVLPSSILRLNALVEKYNRKSVFLNCDINGISLLLSHNHSLHISSNHQPYTPWLHQEYTLAGMKSPAEYIHGDSEKSEAAILTVGHTGHTIEAIKRAYDATNEGALFFCLIREPWDGAFARFLKKSMWEVETIHRDVLHWVLPGPAVRDGGGDVVVLKRPDVLEKAFAEFEQSDAENIRSHPYYAMDVDGLIPESLNEETLLTFADNLAAIAPFAEAGRYHRLEGDRHTLRWADTAGNEVLLELNRPAGHLLTTFLPYNSALEWASVVLIQQSLMSPTSRFRPSRPQWAATKTLFS